MFWEKFQYLSDLKGIKPHSALKELKISSGSANNWKKDTIPNGEMLKKIAEYFDVSIDFLLDSSESVSVNLANKKTFFKNLTSIPQRFNSLMTVIETTDEQKIAIAKYAGCPLWWLLNDSNITFEERNNSETVDSGIIFTILDIMDGCADNAVDRAMQIQLSRVVIHNLEKYGVSRERLSELTAKDIECNKLRFILTGETNKDLTLNFGLNYSDLCCIKAVTGIEYTDMFKFKGR